MTKITQIEDKGATIAWSPVRSHPDVIALGTKDSGGIGFEDTGGELDLYDLNLSSADADEPGPRLLGSVKTISRFASVGWTPGGSIADRFNMGLLAGGMVDGTVHLWDPQALMQQREPKLTSFAKHVSGPVKALQFSPLAPTRLATGGADGAVLITDLAHDNIETRSPSDDYKQSSEITAVAWNTQVAHIVASAAGDGSVAVWDLNSRKAWCELRCETAGQAVADVCWNPSQGLHLLTASLDDRNPILKLWDLRASTSMPLATLAGHTKGILKTAWCPHDDTLLLSCGKDNRTILWDLHTLRPVADVPNDLPHSASDDPNNGQGGLFGPSGLAPAQQRRYDVQWSSLKRGVLATCSLDRKVQVHSVIGLATKCGRPPKWMKPSSSVSCGFGGTVVSCGATDKVVKLQPTVENPELLVASTEFEREIASSNVVDFCESMASRAVNKQEKQTWGFMRVIFESNARQHLLDHLGFDADKIAKAAKEYSDTAATSGVSVNASKAGMSTGAENAVKEALLVGNFEAAVECCFRTGNYADALILASCGGAELWSKAQEKFFEVQAPERPYLFVVSAVIRHQLEDLVTKADVSRWQETLAMLSTYGQSAEFPSLCISLGDKLASAGDHESANLCYMCALSLENAVKFWLSELHQSKTKGMFDLLALHKFVTKVTVFLKAVNSGTTLDPEIADLFSEYAKALSDQGAFVTAAQYCRGDSMKAKILRDSLYRCRSTQMCLQVLGAVPEFPYSFTPRATTRVTPSTTQGSNAHEPSQSSQAAQVDRNMASAAEAQPSGEAEAMLPEGWLQLHDPNSGMYYYANQATGEVTWDRPRPPEHAAQPSYAAPIPAQTPQKPASQEVPQSSGTPATTSRLASKYGDGFVSSASHPELADQYGNVGTSNPYTGVARPGIAQVANQNERPPVSATVNLDAIELKAEYLPMRDALMGMISQLQAYPLSAADKRQVSEAEKGVVVLVKKLARGDLNANVVSNVAALVGALGRKDFTTAMGLQTNLVNSDWREHKDWLKGLKFLIQLASKRL